MLLTGRGSTKVAIQRQRLLISPYRGQHRASTYCRRHQLPTPGAATAEQASISTLEDALTYLAEQFAPLQDLVPEHAVRTNPDFQEPIRLLKEHHEESKVKLEPGMIDGWYDTGMNTTNFLSDLGEITLGALSFQQFGPKDLGIQVQPGYWLDQGQSGHQSYVVVIVFRIAEGEHKGVEGISVPTGTYSIDEKRPYRQNVHFKQLRLFPKDRSPEGVAQFKAALKDDNPTMSEDGVVIIDFPKPIEGWRDHLYVDDTLHITVGNRNNVVIVKRAAAEPPPLW